jgi:uncharacterized iron-regulated protein
MSASLRRAAVSVLATAALGCGGRYGSASADHPRAMKGGRGIEAAALPYQVVDGRTGKSVDEPALWTRLAASHAVCIGEDHQNPHHHWLQLHVVRELIKRLPPGTRLALAMEMFQRPFQGVLDEYAAGRIDDAQLRSRSGYQERWSYDYGFYGPTIDATVRAGGQLLAANAARELTRKVSRHGLESLTPEDRTQLPELVLDDRNHRAWFDAVMDDMGGTSAHSQPRSEDQDDAKPGDAAAKPPTAHGQGKPETDKPAAPAHDDSAEAGMPSADRVYTVQVIWDETMADTGAKWLAGHPGGHLILLAGNGHCHDSAIVARLKRRGIADAVSIRGVIDDAEGAVGDVLARPIHDFVVVLQMPPDVKRADRPRDEPAAK